MGGGRRWRSKCRKWEARTGRVKRQAERCERWIARCRTVSQFEVRVMRLQDHPIRPTVQRQSIVHVLALQAGHTAAIASRRRGRFLSGRLLARSPYHSPCLLTVRERRCGAVRGCPARR